MEEIRLLSLRQHYLRQVIRVSSQPALADTPKISDAKIRKI
jgi:hypothetical protein